MMSAMATVAEFPSIMGDVFLLKEKNAAGILAFQFYIRGKPWRITMDSDLLFNEDSTLVTPVTLEFATEDDSKKILWGALLEKAWARVKGNYDNIDSGFINSGMRSLSNVPVFSYMKADYGDDAKITLLYNLIKAADTAGYVMGFGTDGNGNDKENNSCNMAMSHAYSILSAFKIGTDEVLLARNPWGSTGYNLAGWKHDDAKWTTDNKAKVPLNVDITTANAQGIFALPLSKFKTPSACLDEILIGHERKSEGYKDAWYDKDGDSEATNEIYKVTVPAKSGDLYFTAETYFQRTVPNSCYKSGGPVNPDRLFVVK